MVGFDDNYDSDPNLSNEVYIIEDEEEETTWREEELNIEPNLVSMGMNKPVNQHPTVQRQSIHRQVGSENLISPTIAKKSAMPI